MDRKKIVITHAGCVCAAAHSFSALQEGLTSVPVLSHRQKFDFHELSKELPCFAVTGFDPVAVLGKVGMRTKDWSTKLLLAVLEAEFKPLLNSFPVESRPGLCIGTAFGSVQSIGDFLSESIVSGVNNVNPQLFANTVINSPAGNANIRFVQRNHSSTIATGFNAGFDAFIYAYDQIQCGYQDAIIVGGIEELSYYSLVGMERSGVLSKSGTAQPLGISSDGFIPGEGCAVFMVESQEHAEKRGATILAEIAGTGATFDPDLHAGRPSSDGLSRAMARAFQSSNIQPDKLSYIAASANGTPRTDTAESNALAQVCGTSVPVITYKSYCGECYGAGAALSIACALSDMQHRCMSGHSTASVFRSNLQVIQSRQGPMSINNVLITALSCDGNCGALVLKNRIHIEI